MFLRRVLPPVVAAAALLLTAVPANASGGSGAGSGGGGAGGGVTIPATAAIQLSPDTTTLSAGTTEFVQVVVGPSAPAAGEMLSVTSSSAALTVPATVAVPGGSFDAQFPYTANNVAAATPVTVTVKSATASASFTETVTPAVTPALSGISAFPPVVSGGDAVTLSPTLAAAAPPGGVTVALHSDSPLLALPASVAFPAGFSQPTVTATVGSVAVATTVTYTATLNGKTVSGRLTIDPGRVLTGISVSPNPTDASQAAFLSLSISVPADGAGTFPVALTSSDPAAASVPATTGFGNQDSTLGLAITIGSVSAPTSVTLSATAGGVTKSTTLTVNPVPPPLFDLFSMAISPAVVAGAGSATGTVTATTAAPAGGALVHLSSSDTRSATVPATVVIPAGQTSVTFPIKVLAGNGATDISIGAVFGDHGYAAPLGVTGAKGGSLIQAFTTNQSLISRPVNDVHLDTLGFYSGGIASVESGSLPPGVSLISNLRPGEFVFHGSPQKAGTYTFVLTFNGTVPTPYAFAYVWVITAN